MVYSRLSYHGASLHIIWGWIKGMDHGWLLILAKPLNIEGWGKVWPWNRIVAIKTTPFLFLWKYRKKAVGWGFLSADFNPDQAIGFLILYNEKYRKKSRKYSLTQRFIHSYIIYIIKLVKDSSFIYIVSQMWLACGLFVSLVSCSLLSGSLDYRLNRLWSDSGSLSNYHIVWVWFYIVWIQPSVNRDSERDSTWHERRVSLFRKAAV